MAPELQPSATLQRAAERELERLAKARAKLEKRREALEAEIGEIDGRVDALQERRQLLEQVVRASDAPHARSNGPATAGTPKPALRGAEIRERAAREFFLAHGAGRPAHYREWFKLLTRTGAEISGKDPAATFLTNLNRSPVVIRGPEPGTYAIDAKALPRLGQELIERRAELRDLSDVLARPDADATLVRHRDDLISEVRRLERLAAEAARVLDEVDGPQQVAA